MWFELRMLPSGAKETAEKVGLLGMRNNPGPKAALILHGIYRGLKKVLKESPAARFAFPQRLKPPRF